MTLILLLLEVSPLRSMVDGEGEAEGGLTIARSLIRTCHHSFGEGRRTLGQG
jgi:hypothetical protein